MTKHIKLITFDLDNTLWDVGEVIGRAETIMHNWLEAEVPGFNESFNADVALDLREKLVTDNPGIKHNLSAIRRLVLTEALARFGCSKGSANQYADQAFALFIEARHDVRYFDGALDVLKILSESYILGALSNGNADITRLGLDGVFSFSFSAADIGMSKPAPDMFNAALRHTKVEPSQSLHIGDHLQDDIEGASKVGMHTIWFNQNDPTLTHNATRMALNLRELPGLVETINRQYL